MPRIKVYFICMYNVCTRRKKTRKCTFDNARLLSAVTNKLFEQIC